MKHFYGMIICAALGALTALPATAGKSSPVTPEESNRIIALSFERGIELHKKYSGVESLRKEIISEFDPETKKLKSVSEVTMKRKDFFYSTPEVEVLAYKKDGKEMEPSKFRVMKAMPLFPVFDEKGRDNYAITVTERITFNGRECYRVQVEPRKETSRHFRGSFLVTVRGMETIYIEGTMAKLGFPIKEFRISLNTKNIDNVPLTQTGKVHIRVNVPLFYPDTILESTLTTIETKLMK
ncbi:MAG: hypothetical protein KA369_00920 [Spirochaetes bacterium]|nr:hypothetical protein [Spirochaetota bacterium]